MDNNVYKTEVRKFMILAITWLIIGFLLLEVIPLVPAKEFPIYTPKLLSYLQDDSIMLKYRKDRENYIDLPDVFIEGEDNYADNQTVVYDSSIDHVLVTTGDYVTVDKNGNTVIMKGTARISLARAFGTYSPTNQGFFENML